MQEVKGFQRLWTCHEQKAMCLIWKIRWGLCDLRQRLNRTLLDLNVSMPVVDTSVDLPNFEDDSVQQEYIYSVIYNLKLWLINISTLFENDSQQRHLNAPFPDDVCQLGNGTCDFK